MWDEVTFIPRGDVVLVRYLFEIRRMKYTDTTVLRDKPCKLHSRYHSERVFEDGVRRVHTLCYR